MNKKILTESSIIVLAIILVSLIMRSPITALPLILNNIADALKTNASSLSILTTIPLIMFMLVSNFASKIIQVLGLKRALGCAVLTVVIGSLLRVMMTMPTMLVGTILIGVGIAQLNVFMPSFVAAYFPNKIGLYTSVYSFSMMSGPTLFSLITAPVTTLFGWKMIMWLLLILPTAAILLWWIASRRLPDIDQPKKEDVAQKKTDVVLAKTWTNPRAWAFLLVFGIQSLINYTAVAWLPSLMALHHVSSGRVGFLMSLYSFIAMPISLLLPSLLLRLSNKTQVIMTTIFGSMGIIGSGLLFFQQTSSVWYWALIALTAGVTTAFFFVYVMTMFGIKTDHYENTARLSGMAQTGGYFLASLGPIAYGLAFQSHPEGIGQNIVYMLVVIIMIFCSFVVVKTKKI